MSNVVRLQIEPVTTHKKSSLRNIHLDNILFVTDNGEGQSCNNNNECKNYMLCDGNLNKCRREARYDTPSQDFCSAKGRLCQEKEGNCKNDAECKGSLKCGKDNCFGPSGWSTDADCCYDPGVCIYNLDSSCDQNSPGTHSPGIIANANNTK